MTYGKIFGRQGTHGAPIGKATPNYSFSNRYLYPGAWLNAWQVRYRKTTLEVHAIIARTFTEVTLADVQNALTARDSPHVWKRAIKSYHTKKNRLRDLHNARERTKKKLQT